MTNYVIESEIIEEILNGMDIGNSGCYETDDAEWMEEKAAYSMAYDTYMATQQSYDEALESWKAAQSIYKAGDAEWLEEERQFNKAKEAYDSALARYNDELDLWKTEYSDYEEDYKQWLNEENARSIGAPPVDDELQYYNYALASWLLSQAEYEAGLETPDALVVPYHATAFTDEDAPQSEAPLARVGEMASMLTSGLMLSALITAITTNTIN